MLRFNFKTLIGHSLFNFISIHLMLRFNINRNIRLRQRNTISIHLMLRFNSDDLNSWLDTHRFQYILCCGSTIFQKWCKWRIFYFNTSYVAVQPLWLYILLFSSYQKSTEVTIFFIIFSNDKCCLGKNKKITWKDLKYQVFLFVLLFFNWKNFSICSL